MQHICSINIKESSSSETFKTFIQQQIEEILNKDKDISIKDYLYHDLKYYLAGIRYLSKFFPHEKIYIRIENKHSPLAEGRKSKETNEIWEYKLIQKYREKYSLLNQVIQHSEKCEYLRVSFTHKQLNSDSICISPSIADKLYSILMQIQDDCRILEKETKVEGILKNSVEGDIELKQFLNSSIINLEKSLYDAVDTSSLHFSNEDMLKTFLMSFRFHLHKKKYLNQEIDALCFPIGYGAETTLVGAVIMGFARILEKDHIYFCIQMWRNILLALSFYEAAFKESG